MLPLENVTETAMSLMNTSINIEMSVWHVTTVKTFGSEKKVQTSPKETVTTDHCTQFSQKPRQPASPSKNRVQNWL